MLTTSTGLQGLDATKLRPGDVILSADNSPTSQAIRSHTRSDISHAMIYVESHSIIEANNTGVHARNTQRLHYPADRALYVLRPREPLTPAEAQTVCDYVRSKVGSQYTILEAVQSISPIRARASRRQFCSRLVGQAYAAAGRPLGGDPDYLSPGDLLRSQAFEHVTDATIAIDESASARWANHEDMTAAMVTATNAVLADVRKLDPAVQTFDDVIALLIAEPEHDAAVLTAYEASGYLEVWRASVEATPWQYSLLAMSDAARGSRDQVEAYCLDTLRNVEGSDRYERNLTGYENLQQQYNLRTFARLRQLYAQLVRLHTQRWAVALAWLRAHAPSLVSGGKPHTEEWFAALQLRNPTQAAMFRATLAAADTTEGCSICAYDPAGMERSRAIMPESANLKYASDAYAAAKGADAVLILTDWAEFASLDLAKLKETLRYPILLDGRNLYDPQTVADLGLSYVSVGRPAAHPLRQEVAVAK